MLTPELLQIDGIGQVTLGRSSLPEVRVELNPLALLRLSLACGPAGRMPNRRIVEALMRHVWQADGADPNDPARLAALRASLAPERDPDSDEVKAELRALTDAAIARGVFGVPTFEALGKLYWGLDALPMLREDPLAADAG